jgi:FkbM family methyltransferase
MSRAHAATPPAARPAALPPLYRAAATARRVLGARGSRVAYASPLARPLRRVLASRAPGGTASVRVCAGALEGASMLVDLSCEKYYWLGTHEEPVQRLLVERLRPGDVVYDIGAHAGFFSLLASRLVSHEGRVVAFEPNPQNATRLRANLAANDATNVDVYEAAVSDACGDAAFVAPGSPLQGRLAHAGEDAAIRVETTTIDALVAAGAPAPRLMKIDVEGAEGAAMRGARVTIAAHRPELVIEVHSTEAGAAVIDALPCRYVFRNIDTGAVSGARLSPGHYLGLFEGGGAL